MPRHQRQRTADDKPGPDTLCLELSAPKSFLHLSNVQSEVSGIAGHRGAAHREIDSAQHVAERHDEDCGCCPPQSQAKGLDLRGKDQGHQAGNRPYPAFRAEG